jgi:hypothetical protein
MRAYTTNHRSAAWRVVFSAAIVACWLALPATAGARPIDLPHGAQYSSFDVGGGPYVGSTSQTGGPNVSQERIVRPNEGFVSPDHLRYTGPPFDTSQPVASSDGFDWLSAAIGAAAAMALVALGSAVFLTVRRRTAVSPSVASMS